MKAFRKANLWYIHRYLAEKQLNHSDVDIFGSGKWKGFLVHKSVAGTSAMFSNSMLTTSRMTGMVNSCPGHSYLSAMKCSDQLRYFDSAVLFSKFLNWFGDHSTYRGPVKAPYINQFHEPPSENRPPLLLKAMLPTEHTKREIGIL